MESSAFFIQDEKTGHEIIIFGDIEPDSVSLEPRNKRVWEIAAPKIASGCLRAIFIECSYNDAVDDETLYGHLCPRHLIDELKVLAAKVAEARLPPREQEQEQRDQRRRGRSSKRKRTDSDSANGPVSPHSTHHFTPTQLAKPRGSNERSPKSGRASISTQTPAERRADLTSNNIRKSSDDDAVMTEEIQTENGIVDGDVDEESRPGTAVQWASSVSPLAGFKVYIIHVKDTLTDGPHPGERILQELRSQSEDAGLGCEFYVPFQGEGILV